MKIKPKAILFDMDGVLIDSIDSWWNALNQALKTFNIKQKLLFLYLVLYSLNKYIVKY